MRKDFTKLLQTEKIDVKTEYNKLFRLFYRTYKYDGKTLSNTISDHFLSYPFRGTCFSLYEFDRAHNIKFFEKPKGFNIDYFISFAEYVLNLLIPLDERLFPDDFSKAQHITHIYEVIDKLDYISISANGFQIFVPKNGVPMEVAELSSIPAPVSYKIISYNHHSMNGNLDEKRLTLLQLADLLEPKRPLLDKIDKHFSSDLFYSFNTFNIRHNNIDPEGKKYKKAIADMSASDLEHWYDAVYQMCLLAFLLMEQENRKMEFNTLKNSIENQL